MGSVKKEIGIRGDKIVLKIELDSVIAVGHTQLTDTDDR